MQLSRVPGNCGLLTLSGNDHGGAVTKENMRTLLADYRRQNNDYSTRKIMAFTTGKSRKALKKAGFKFSDWYVGNSAESILSIYLWDVNKNFPVKTPFKQRFKKVLIDLINKL